MHYHALDALAPICVTGHSPFSIAKELSLSAGPPDPAPVPSPHRVGVPVAQPSDETLRLYAADWRAFAEWCRVRRASALPADRETLAAHLLALASALSRGALGRRRAAVAAMHRQYGYPPPTLDRADRAALRQAPRQSTVHTPAPTPAQLRHLAGRCSRDLPGLRDRAILLMRATPIDWVPRAPPLVGSQGAKPLALSTLLTLTTETLRFTSAGVMLAPGQPVLPRAGSPAIPCPVRALEDWLRASDTTFGPVFRKIDRWGNVEHAGLGPGAVRQILRRHLARAGARL